MQLESVGSWTTGEEDLARIKLEQTFHSSQDGERSQVTLEGLKCALAVDDAVEIGCFVRANKTHVARTIQEVFGSSEQVAYEICREIDGIYNTRLSEAEFDLWKLNFPALMPILRKMAVQTTGCLIEIVSALVCPDNTLLPRDEAIDVVEMTILKQLQRLRAGRLPSMNDPCSWDSCNASPLHLTCGFLPTPQPSFERPTSEQLQDAVDELLLHRRDVIALRSRLELLPEKPQSKRRIACTAGKQGLLEFDRWIFQEVIDTPPVQRLGRIKQLGACYAVYPMARHTRFEHSLGVGHLAAAFWGKLLNAANYGPMTYEAAHIRDSLIIAGICHDLGHGPFSHTFETSFVNKIRHSHNPWRHEDMSLELFDMICDSDLNVDEVDKKMIRDIMTGEGTHSGKTYCGDSFENLRQASYAIVANKRCGIDVDRFDYLQRDCQIAENLPRFKPDRIMDFARVIEGDICFHQKERSNVFDMFVSRNRMFQEVYTHRKVRAIELMICDALECVDDVLGISSMVNDPAEYLTLDDTIWETCMRRCRQSHADDEDHDKFEKAAAIFHRVERRDTYRFAGDCAIFGPLDRIKEHFTVEKLVAAQVPSEDTAPFTASDLILDWSECHYGAGAQCPMDSVWFYDPKDPTVRFKIPSREERTWLTAGPRVFTRDNRTALSLVRAFRNWLTEYVPESQRGAAVLGRPRQTVPSPVRRKAAASAIDRSTSIASVMAPPGATTIRSSEPSQSSQTSCSPKLPAFPL